MIFSFLLHSVQGLVDGQRKKKRKKNKGVDPEDREEGKSVDKIISVKTDNFKNVIEDIKEDISGSVETITSKDSCGDDKGLNKVRNIFLVITVRLTILAPN